MVLAKFEYAKYFSYVEAPPTFAMQSYKINSNKNHIFLTKMNKDVLVALIAKDVNELQILTEGLDQMETIPAPYLRLALDKSKTLTANLENLINYLNNKELEYAAEVQRQAELATKQAEEAAREAELARIAEEQEALLRAQELERERQAEERRKAEAEIARQVAALEVARQLELEEKRRKEEAEARRKEEERIRIEAEQAEARRKIEAEEKARVEEEQRIREIAEKQKSEQERLAAEKHQSEQINISIVDAVAENQPQTLAESIETSESLADKLAKTADDTLAEVINNKKIIDLKSSITLGDRFRFQRELFGGNGEKMNKAISDFNSFETMAEAQSYIAKNFDWPLDNDAVSDFIQLLQRRYL